MEKQLLFRLGEQIFALPLPIIEKIISPESVSKVPDVEPYLMGVMEYNGNVLPLVDLPKRFFQDELENPQESQTIIVEWQGHQIGLTVDEVTSVAMYEETDLYKVKEESEEPHSIQSVKAFVQTDNGLVSLVDCDELFNEKGSADIRRLLDITSLGSKEDD